MLQKTINHYSVNLSINNATDRDLPYLMEIEMTSMLLKFTYNAIKNTDYIKARAFEYLQKILYADLCAGDDADFLNILLEDKDNIIAYAGGLESYGNDYIIVAIKPACSDSFNIYAFSTYNEGDIFDLYKYKEDEQEV